MTLPGVVRVRQRDLQALMDVLGRLARGYLLLQRSGEAPRTRRMAVRALAQARRSQPD